MCKNSLPIPAVPMLADTLSQSNLLHRPYSCLSQHFIFALCPRLQLRQKLRLTTIAHRNGNVTMQPLTSSPFQWRAFEPTLELLRIHPCQPVQRRIYQLWPCLHASSYGDRRDAVPLPRVPRTDILADVAAKHLPSHPGTQIRSDRPFLLNCQICNAPRRIHLPRRNQRIRGTRIDAPGTTPAPIRSNTCSASIRYLQRSYDHPQQQPGTLLLVDHASILSNPPHSRSRRESSLDNRPRIHIATRLAIHRLKQPRLYLPQTSKHLFVIVRRHQLLPFSSLLPYPFSLLSSAPRIPPNPSSIHRCRIDRTRILRTIIQRTDNDRPRPWHRHPQPLPKQIPFRIAPLQILHLARPSRLNPGLETIAINPSPTRVAFVFRTSDTGKMKPSLNRLRSNRLFKLRSPCHQPAQYRPQSLLRSILCPIFCTPPGIP